MMFPILPPVMIWKAPMMSSLIQLLKLIHKKMKLIKQAKVAAGYFILTFLKWTLPVLVIIAIIYFLLFLITLFR